MHFDPSPYQGLPTTEALLMCFDLETTGVNVHQDRIVQMAVSYFHQRRRIQQHTQMFNPEQPIPPGASSVHGIYDADVQSMPTFGSFIGRLAPHFEGETGCGSACVGLPA